MASTVTPRALFLSTAIAIIGLIVFWIGRTGPDAIFYGNLRRAGVAVSEGDSFRTSVLVAATRQIDDVEFSGCFPETTRSAALIYFARAEALLNEGKLADAAVYRAKVNQLTDMTLSCAPASGFDWLLKFWYKVIVQSKLYEAASYVQMQYRTAPYEGWLAARRLPYFLLFLNAIDDNLRMKVIGDFSLLLNEKQFPLAASIFSSSSSEVRNLLLKDALVAAPLEYRTLFTRNLRPFNIEITLPGVNSQTLPPYMR